MEEHLTTIITGVNQASPAFATAVADATAYKAQIDLLNSSMTILLATSTGLEARTDAVAASYRLASEEIAVYRGLMVATNKTLGQTQRSLGNVRDRAREAHTELGKVGGQMGLPRSGKGLGPYTQQVKGGRQATDELTKSQKSNIIVSGQQGRMWGFAAREVYGLRLGMLGSVVSGSIFGKMLFDLALNSMHLGEEIANVKIAFDKTFSGSGTSPTLELEALREASKGLVTDFELMKTAVFVAQFPFENLKLLLPDIVKASTNLALAQGKDIPQSIDDMVRALGRGSSKILDNLGIILKVEQAQSRYARQLGKTTKELTEQEKAQAFAVIGTQMLIEKGAQYEELNRKAAAGTTAIRNSADELAESWAKSNEGFASFLSLIAGGLGLFGELIKLYDRLEQLILSTGGKFFEFTKGPSPASQQKEFEANLASALGMTPERLKKELDRSDVEVGFQKDPASFMTKMLKQSNEMADETTRHADSSDSAREGLPRYMQSMGVPESEAEEPKIRQAREVAERKHLRQIKALNRFEHEQRLRQVTATVESSKKYLESVDNAPPGFDPLTRSQDKILKLELSREEQTKRLVEETRRQTTLYNQKTELFKAANRMVEDQNKNDARSSKKKEDLDKKLNDLRKSLVDIEADFVFEQQKEKASGSVSHARRLVHEERFRMNNRISQGLPKTQDPIKMAIEQTGSQRDSIKTEKDKEKYLRALIEAINDNVTELDRRSELLRLANKSLDKEIKLNAKLDTLRNGALFAQQRAEIEDIGSARKFQDNYDPKTNKNLFQQAEKMLRNQKIHAKTDDDILVYKKNLIAVYKVLVDKAKEQASLYSDAGDIIREHKELVGSAWEALSEGAYHMADLLGDNASKFVGAMTNMLSVAQNFNKFKEVGGLSGLAGQAGTAGTLLAGAAEIGRNIQLFLTREDKLAEKQKEAADELLKAAIAIRQANADFTKGFLGDFEPFVKLQKGVLDPIIKLAEFDLGNAGDDPLKGLRVFFKRFDEEIGNKKIGNNLEREEIVSGILKSLGFEKQRVDAGRTELTRPDGSISLQDLGLDQIADLPSHLTGLFEELSKLFGPNATFQQVQHEAIRLSDAFEELVDQTKGLTDLQKQGIKDESSVERARLRGIASNKIAGAGDDFVERERIVRQLRSDLEQVRTTEKRNLDDLINRTPGSTESSSVSNPSAKIIPEIIIDPSNVIIIDDPAVVDPAQIIEIEEPSEMVNELLSDIKDTISESLTHLTPLLVSIKDVIEASRANPQDGHEVINTILENLHDGLSQGITGFTTVIANVDRLMSADPQDLADNPQLLTEILGSIAYGLNSGLRGFEKVRTSLDELVAVDQDVLESHPVVVTGLLGTLKSQIGLGLEEIEKIPTSIDGLLVSLDSEEDGKSIMVTKVFSSLKTKLNTGIDNFIKINASLDELVFAHFGSMPKDIQDMLTMSVSGGIAGTPRQVFDLSDKIDIRSGNLGAKISQAIDQALSSALSNADDPFSYGGDIGDPFNESDSIDDLRDNAVKYENPNGPYVARNGRVYTIDGRVANQPRASQRELAQFGLGGF